MSSEPHNNFFLIAMDGIVYKYDLTTKQLLYQFQTDATKIMVLYDHDDKLLVASEHKIKLWNFDESKYEMPEIWTTEEFKDPIENVFVNQYSRGPLTIVVVSNDKLFIF